MTTTTYYAHARRLDRWRWKITVTTRNQGFIETVHEQTVYALTHLGAVHAANRVLARWSKPETFTIDA